MIEAVSGELYHIDFSRVVCFSITGIVLITCTTINFG